MAANTNTQTTQGTGVPAAAVTPPLNNSSGAIPTAIKNFKDKLAEAEEKRKKLTSTETISLLPEESSKYFTSIAIGEYKRGGDIKKVVKTNKGDGFKLPIPMRLTDSNAVDWSAEKLGFVGALSEGQVTQGILSAAGKAAGTSGLYAQSLAGIAPNEFLTLLFKGPVYKKFSLSFMLSPNTPEMSKKLHEMILNFKNAQAPADLGALFAYPSIFFIRFHGSEYLFEFKPAVLESFTVDYAGAGVPAFYKGTGAPESYNLTMNFQEIEFWMSGDFKDSQV